jgi:hypothetical protein
MILTHLALNYNLLGKHSMNTATVDDQTLCADMISQLAAVTRGLRNESFMRRVHMYTGVRVCNRSFPVFPCLISPHIDVLDEGAQHVP